MVGGIGSSQLAFRTGWINDYNSMMGSFITQTGSHRAAKSLPDRQKKKGGRGWGGGICPAQLIELPVAN